MMLFLSNRTSKDTVSSGLVKREFTRVVERNCVRALGAMVSLKLISVGIHYILTG